MAMDTWPPGNWPPKLYQFDSAGNRVAVPLPGTDQARAAGDQPGTAGGQQQGSGLPGIGATPDSVVAEDSPGAFADGAPVSPVVAARRYGPAAGQGYRGTSPDPGAA